MTPRRSTSATLAWAGVALLLLVPVWWGVHRTFTWDSDNLAPGQVLRAMGQHFRPGWFSVYGPLPYYLMAAACAPVLAFFKLTGELGRPSGVYPFGFAHPDLALTAIVVASRLVSVLMALGTVMVAARDLRRDHPRAAGWIVPVLLIGSAQFAYYGRTSNVDAHALFWLFLAVSLVETRPVSLQALAGGAAAAACAVCSKEQSGPMAAVLVAAACWQALRTAGTLPRRLLAASAVGGAALLAYAVLWGLPFNLVGWKAHHAFLFADALGPRKFEPTAAGIAAFAGQCLSYAPLALGLPVLFGLALALALRVRLRGLGLRALLALAHAVGFLGRIGYVFPRFIMPFLVLALPLAARGYAAAGERGRGVARLVAVAALLLALPGGPLLSYLQLDDPRLPAERWITAHVPAGATIELSGNAHNTLRPPAGYRVTQVMEKTLMGDLHGPVGDLVVVSSIDTVLLIRDPRVRAAWWDEVHAPPPAGRYRVAAVFPRPPVARWLDPMWIAPTITLYQREAPAAPASATSP